MKYFVYHIPSRCDEETKEHSCRLAFKQAGLLRPAGSTALSACISRKCMRLHMHQACIKFCQLCRCGVTRIHNKRRPCILSSIAKTCNLSCKANALVDLHGQDVSRCVDSRCSYSSTAESHPLHRFTSNQVWGAFKSTACLASRMNRAVGS